jgi:hypothetical protein
MQEMLDFNRFLTGLMVRHFDPFNALRNAVVMVLRKAARAGLKVAWWHRETACLLILANLAHGPDLIGRRRYRHIVQLLGKCGACPTFDGTGYLLILVNVATSQHLIELDAVPARADLRFW